MSTFDENIARVVRSMGDAARKSAQGESFFVGTVKAAGRGELRVSAAGMDLTAGDLYVSTALRYDWTEDDGSPDYLRPGDRVALLSTDGQTFYLVARTVRV